MKTKKCIKYPSIEQFRTVISNVNRRVGYAGMDDNGEAIYDHTRPKPVLTFKGTVKLHGTNAGVSYNTKDGIWYQSRENIITPTQDNAGFAFFANGNEATFIEMFESLAKENGVDLDNNTITIYGEWAGASIQKNVGITNLPKSFFIFGVKASPFEIEGLEKQAPAYWLDSTELRKPESNIFNIDDYETFSIDIDFNVPQMVQNTLVDLTIRVEEECPVAKAFGFLNTIGEGIVWTYTAEDGTRYLFKTKGEKHAGKSKVKTIHKVDDVKLQKILDLASAVTPVWRLAQMLEQACDLNNGGQLDRSKLGEYIKLVIADIVKEDSDLIVKEGLELKDIAKYVSETSRRYFFEQEAV